MYSDFAMVDGVIRTEYPFRDEGDFASCTLTDTSKVVNRVPGDIEDESGDEVRLPLVSRSLVANEGSLVYSCTAGYDRPSTVVRLSLVDTPSEPVTSGTESMVVTAFATSGTMTGTEILEDLQDMLYPTEDPLSAGSPESLGDTASSSTTAVAAVAATLLAGLVACGY
jgi:hypothetical protein